MLLNKIFKNYYLETIVILIIFFLDRISKLFVIHLDKLNFNSEIYASKFLNIHLIWNGGIAFGLFSFKEDYLYNFLTFLIFIVIIFIILMIRKSDLLEKYALLLVLGGALGNFFDRLIYKAVPDFIDFHVGNFHWFIFNVSDIFITIGVIMIILIEIFKKSNKSND
ncbi:signal peptidase II [Candidatus Pelagibacter communis]|uniref:signal peptidase II n=1 Tax=Pelagibacter ubique TaxID=198252 RepID=UPI00065B37CE|nr:signal peptidase II [Candidatus Pelagibacter ubique]